MPSSAAAGWLTPSRHIWPARGLCGLTGDSQSYGWRAVDVCQVDVGAYEKGGSRSGKHSLEDFGGARMGRDHFLAHTLGRGPTDLPGTHRCSPHSPSPPPRHSSAVWSIVHVVLMGGCVRGPISAPGHCIFRAERPEAAWTPGGGYDDDDDSDSHAESEVIAAATRRRRSQIRAGGAAGDQGSGAVSSSTSATAVSEPPAVAAAPPPSADGGGSADAPVAAAAAVPISNDRAHVAEQQEEAAMLHELDTLEAELHDLDDTTPDDI
jgi:hypothetical protein